MKRAPYVDMQSVNTPRLLLFLCLYYYYYYHYYRHIVSIVLNMESFGRIRVR